MKIIREGSPSRANNFKRFKCAMCGCIWEANSSEYRKLPHITSFGRVLQFSILCNCPCCDYEAVTYETVDQAFI